MNKTKLGKILFSTALICVFLIALLSILASMWFGWSRALVDVLLIMAIFCLGCVSSSLLVKLLDKTKNKKPLYVVLGMVGFTCLLWMIFIFIGQNLIDAVTKEMEYDGTFVWVYAKFAIVVTIQTAFATAITTGIYSLKKKMYVFQGIAYLSNIIVDLWLTALILNCKLVDNNFVFTGDMLFKKGVMTIFIIGAVFTVISSIALKRIYKKTAIAIAIDNFEEKEEVKVVKNEVQEPSNDLEERLIKLDSLKQKGLISEEDYLEKKKKILEEL